MSSPLWVWIIACVTNEVTRRAWDRILIRRCQSHETVATLARANCDKTTSHKRIARGQGDSSTAHVSKYLTQFFVMGKATGMDVDSSAIEKKSAITSSKIGKLKLRMKRMGVKQSGLKPSKKAGVFQTKLKATKRHLGRSTGGPKRVRQRNKGTKEDDHEEEEASRAPMEVATALITSCTSFFFQFHLTPAHSIVPASKSV